MNAAEVQTLIQRRDALPRTSPCRGAIYKIIRDSKTAELREAVFWSAWAQQLSKEVRELGGSN